MILASRFLFFSFLIPALLAAPSHGKELLEGVLLRDPERGLLVSSRTATLPLVPVTKDSVALIARLGAGDFLKGEGDVRDGRFFLQNIQGIGFSQLLGRWLSDDGELLEFEDFKWGRRVFPARSVSQIETVVVFDYSIVPGLFENWRILLRTPAAVQAVTMVLHEDKIMLTYYNDVTGEELASITYSRANQ